jgi:putative flippase GtrA
MNWLRTREWLRRTAKFSMVGAIGIGVQLLVLAVLTGAKINYLLATLLAVESAIIHNFFWHQGFTWRERISTRRFEVIGRFARFHLSNGLISVVGNLFMMRLLVGSLGLPVIAANVLSISLCFVANFIASDRWVFSLERAGEMAKGLPGGVTVKSSLCDRASAPMCVLRKEHTGEQQLRPATARDRFAVQAETVIVPILRPR